MRDFGGAQSQRRFAPEELLGEDVTKDRAEIEEITGEQCALLCVHVRMRVRVRACACACYNYTLTCVSDCSTSVHIQCA